MAKADWKDTAFRVGDEVVCAGRSFELWEIIKQFSSIDGERRYCISSPLIRSSDGTVETAASGKQRDVRESELKRLDEVLDGLLDDAKARKGNATRNALLAALSCAQNDYRQLTKKLPPAKLVASLEKSIAKTRELLAVLTKYGIPTEIERHVCKIGAGVVDVLPLPFETPKTFTLEEVQDELLKQMVFQCGPPFEGTAGVRMQNLLSAWHDSVKRAPRKKREGQKKEDKTAIVERAVQFFRQHSTTKPSTDPDNPIHLFVARFCERVTGSSFGDLDYQIRKVLKAQARCNSAPKTGD